MALKAGMGGGWDGKWCKSSTGNGKITWKLEGSIQNGDISLRSVSGT